MTHQTAILANGQFPELPLLHEQLRAADYLVCCDGAAMECIRRVRMPDVVIGDLDSLPEALRRDLEKKTTVVHVAEQETNDLAKAFRFCLEKGFTEHLTLYGATGKREDHTLGNIAHLVDFAEQVPSIRMATDAGDFFVLNQSGSFSTYKGQAVSLFALFPQTVMTSTGLQYPLDHFTPTRLWQATLNVATGNSVSLEISGGHPVLIYVARQ